MTQFATLSGSASVKTRFVQGATAENLESNLNAAIAAAGTTQLVTNITLAGGGDGHTFVVMVESADPSDISSGGLVATSPFLVARCFLAATAESLVVALSAIAAPAALPNPPLPAVPYGIVDTQVAGASKGTRFMGLKLFYVDAPPLNLFRPGAVVTYTGSPVALTGGANIVAFSTIDNLAAFSRPAAQVLQYNGGRTLNVFVDANATVEVTAGGTFTVAIVVDPLGTPGAIIGGGVSVGKVAAGEDDNVAVTGYTTLASSLQNLPSSKLGLRIVMPSAGFVLGAALRAMMQ